MAPYKGAPGGIRHAAAVGQQIVESERSGSGSGAGRSPERNYSRSGTGRDPERSGGQDGAGRQDSNGTGKPERGDWKPDGQDGAEMETGERIQETRWRILVSSAPAGVGAVACRYVGPQGPPSRNGRRGNRIDGSGTRRRDNRDKARSRLRGGLRLGPGGHPPERGLYI